MRTSRLLFVLLLLLHGILVAYAPGANPSKGSPGDQLNIAGFWLGMWQGFIAPLVFVVSLFRNNLNIYEIHNNGAWYNLGYLFGLACFFGGGGSKAGRKR